MDAPRRKTVRSMVRQRVDQELEDGVILHGAFKGRGTGRNTLNGGDDGIPDRPRGRPEQGDQYIRIWTDKSTSAKYQHMLVGEMATSFSSLKLTWPTGITKGSANVGVQGAASYCCGPESSRYHLWRDRMVRISKYRQLVDGANS